MVRAAAKNHASVAIVTSPDAYSLVVEALGQGGFTLAQRQRLAAEAFVHTATYDNAVANWMGSVLADTTDGTGFPAWTGATWDRVAPLRYGENPHQPAALYRHWRPGIAQAEHQPAVDLVHLALRHLVGDRDEGESGGREQGEDDQDPGVEPVAVEQAADGSGQLHWPGPDPAGARVQGGAAAAGRQHGSSVSASETAQAAGLPSAR